MQRWPVGAYTGQTPMSEGVRLLVFVGIAAVGVSGVVALALLPRPRWLDRVWLALIAAAVLFLVPLWIALKVQDYGWKTVAAAVLGLFVLGFIKGWPATDATPRR